MEYFVKGVILGFSIAAPVGPIGVLCIRRTLANGMMNGFLSGLGAATADGLYGCVAAFGITVISAFLVDHQTYLQLLGAFFLFYMGYTTFRSVPADEAAEASNKGFFGAYTSTLSLTLTNPMTIISFTAIFAGLGVGITGTDHTSSVALVFGVFTGSLLWWLILSKSVSVLRAKFDQRSLVWVNRLSGIIIVGFGVLSLATI